MLAPTSAGSASTILLVDDEPDILAALKELLEGSFESAQVLTARSGGQALEILQKQTVDVVLSDYKMPGMNGLQLLREVSRINERIPRILMSAYEVDMGPGDWVAAEVKTLIRKPLDPSTIIARLRALLNGRN